MLHCQRNPTLVQISDSKTEIVFERLPGGPVQCLCEP